MLKQRDLEETQDLSVDNLVKVTIPNQNGTLCRERDLRNGESTTKGLVKTIRMMIKSDTQKLVDPEYRDIADFEQYSWNDLMEKIYKMAESNEAVDTDNKEHK